MSRKSLVLLSFLLFTYLTNAQNNSNGFWEKVEAKIKYPPDIDRSWHNKTFEYACSYPRGNMKIISNGNMIINLGGKHYICSKDGGLTWKPVRIKNKNGQWIRDCSWSDIEHTKDFFVLNPLGFHRPLNFRGDPSRDNIYISYDGLVWQRAPANFNSDHYHRMLTGMYAEIRNKQMIPYLKKHEWYLLRYKTIFHLADNTISIDTTSTTYIQKSEGLFVQKPKSDKSIWSGYFTFIKHLWNPCGNNYYEIASSYGDLHSTDLKNFKNYPSEDSRYNHHIQICNLQGGTIKVGRGTNGGPDDIRFMFKAYGAEKWIDTGDLLKSIAYDPATKRIYGLKIDRGTATLYRSKNEMPCSCGSSGTTTTTTIPEKKKNFGTTVITHGTFPHGPIAESYETWIEKMANDILEKAGQGIIYLYNPNNGEYEVFKTLGTDAGEGEQILLFNWFEKSIWFDTKAYAYSAANDLFLSLSAFNDKIPLDSIHFIGYDVGNYVNSQAIKKMLQFKQEIGKPFSVDQLTMLVPANYATNKEVELEQIKTWAGINYTDIYISEYEPVISNLYITRLAAIETAKIAAKKLDKYLQVSRGERKINISESVVREIERLADGVSPGQLNESSLYNAYTEFNNMLGAVSPYAKDLAELSFLMDIFRVLLQVHSVYENWNSVYSIGVKPAQTFTWTNLNPQEINAFYTETINTTYDYGGYSLSRLMNGEKERSISPTRLGKEPEPFDWQQLGIFNGSFQYVSNIYGTYETSGMPGWEILGGKYDNSQQHCLLQKGGLLLHEHLYVPKAANAITLSIKTKNVKEGVLAVDFIDATGTIVDTKFVKITADIVKFVERKIDASLIKGKVVEMSFFFTAKAYDEKGPEPKIYLDDIKFSQ